MSSRPWIYLVFLLRLAETVLAQGPSISIFALDYHLAPEHPYPTQLEEAKAAYSYLLHEMGVDPEKIVVAGDSAGGHLALSLLVELQAAEKKVPKPGGLVLMSPWLSLYHYPATNAERDVISTSFLRATAERYLGPYTGSRYAPSIEFLNPEPAIDWDTVLPSWIWTSAGTNELMFDVIVAWTQSLERKLETTRVGCEWGLGEVHDWQWLETMDKGSVKRFLEKEEECGDFEGVVKIGRAIVERMGKRKGGR